MELRNKYCFTEDFWNSSDKTIRNSLRSSIYCNVQKTYVIGCRKYCFSPYLMLLTKRKISYNFHPVGVLHGSCDKNVFRLS